MESLNKTPTMQRPREGRLSVSAWMNEEEQKVSEAIRTIESSLGTYKADQCPTCNLLRGIVIAIKRIRAYEDESDSQSNSQSDSQSV